MKDLRNPEKVKIGDKTYVLSDIPAFQATKMLMKAFSSLSSGNVANIPPDVIQDLLSYAAIVNPNGAEVQFDNEDLIDMMVPNAMDLIELVSRMVEKNFGFFGDGRLKSALSRVVSALTGSRESEAEGTPAT